MNTKSLIPVVTNASGTYRFDDRNGTVWEYELTVSGLGTKSEHHFGVLHLNGAEIAGASKGARVDTPWGQMQYMESFSDKGFLLAGFGGHPIDPSIGVLLPAANPTPNDALAVASVAQWRYQVALHARTTKSESRLGRLWRGTAEIVGHAPDAGLSTPWGRLCYTGSPPEPLHYGSWGWLLWGCYDALPWKHPPGLRALESLYRASSGHLGHQVALVLPEGAELLDEWDATIWIDPNTCTINDFGDRQGCTRMAVRNGSIRGSRARLEDPMKCSRRVYLLTGEMVSGQLSLVVDAAFERWFLKAENELIALYPADGLP